MRRTQTARPSGIPNQNDAISVAAARSDLTAAEREAN